MSNVRKEQRFTQESPCPICQGWESDSRGRGTRCFGFVTSGREYVYCTREEFSDGVPYFEPLNAWRHPYPTNGIAPKPKAARRRVGKKVNGKGTATFDYHDEQGELLFQVVRKEPKAFRQRRPDGKGGWIQNLQGVRRVLYRLPELLKANPEEVVHVVEGEKDADVLSELGLVATCNPGGAGKWQDGFSEVLQDRWVVILPDNDSAGQAHANRVARSLCGRVKSVKVIDLPGLAQKGDVSDWLAAGGTVAALQTLYGQAEEWQDPDALEPIIVRASEVEEQEVAFLWEPYLPQGRLAILAGDSGVGKSFLALGIAAVISKGECWPVTNEKAEQGTVLYASAEDSVSDTLVKRLRLMGADMDRVLFMEGAREQDGHEVRITLEDVSTWEMALRQHKPTLLVIDPVQGYMKAKTDFNKANEIRSVLAPLAALAEKYNCTVLVICHLNKSSNNRKVMLSILGSVDFAAAARSVLFAGKTPSDERAVLHLKSSVSAQGCGVGFEISETGAFTWTGETDLTPQQMNYDEDGKKPRKQTKCEQAIDYLAMKLANGPVPATEVLEDYEHSERTLRTAKDTLGVEAKKKGGIWFWSLPKPKGAGVFGERLAKMQPGWVKARERKLKKGA